MAYLWYESRPDVIGLWHSQYHVLRLTNFWLKTSNRWHIIKHSSISHLSLQIFIYRLEIWFYARQPADAYPYEATILDYTLLEFLYTDLMP